MQPAAAVRHRRRPARLTAPATVSSTSRAEMHRQSVFHEMDPPISRDPHRGLNCPRWALGSKGPDSEAATDLKVQAVAKLDKLAPERSSRSHVYPPPRASLADLRAAARCSSGERSPGKADRPPRRQYQRRGPASGVNSPPRTFTDPTMYPQYQLPYDHVRRQNAAIVMAWVSAALQRSCMPTFRADTDHRESGEERDDGSRVSTTESEDESEGRRGGSSRIR
jgi:hypothetical protein